MKIIDKRKDYYDYLTGYYGIDPKLVLDRRDFGTFEFLTPTKIIIFFCGKRIEGLFDGFNYYYGEKLLEFGEISKRQYSFFNKVDKKSKTVDIKIENHERYSWDNIYNFSINLDVVDDEYGYNKKENCPILLSRGTIWGNVSNTLLHFPKLSDIGFGSVYSADEAFRMLTEWLSNEITEKENIIDKRNDVQKLESKGFDKKTSFRNL